MTKPNVIFLVADQLRHDVLGKGYTPNIDKLIGESVKFTNAYCASPICVPARGSMFTGVYPAKNGCLINPWRGENVEYGKVNAEYDNIYDLFERQDYECIHSGKQHFYVKGEQLQERKNSKTKWVTTEKTYQTFLKENGKKGPSTDLFRSLCPEMISGKHTHLKSYSNANVGHYENGYDYYFDGYFTNEVMTALKERNKDKSLFLSMMFLAPHPPLNIPSPYYENGQKYEPELPVNIAKFYEHQSPLQVYNLPGVMGMGRTYEQWVESWKAYLSLVKLLDDCVGQILTQLKDDGVYDDSLIFFSSDHGEMMGSHSLFQKMCMYESSTKIPFTIKLPNGIKSDVTIDNVISHIDLMPTICELLDIELNHVMDGESLVDLIDGKTSENRNIAFIQFDGNGALGNFQRCIVDGDYKLIMDIFKDETYYELYNVKTDEHETTNLLFEHGYMSIAKACLSKLLKHMDEVLDPIKPTNIDLDLFVQQY